MLYLYVGQNMRGDTFIFNIFDWSISLHLWSNENNNDVENKKSDLKTLLYTLEWKLSSSGSENIAS